MKTLAGRWITLLATCALLAVGCEATGEPEEIGEEKPEGLSVKIVSTTVDDDRDHSIIHATIRFTNNTPAPVWILKPVDGSEWGWHMPHYLFTVVAESGEIRPPGPRCGLSGLYADTQWPNDYLVEIRPGCTFETTCEVPNLAYDSGKHTVRFQYVYQPVQEQFPPPPQAWRGTLNSDPITVKCNPKRNKIEPPPG